MSCSNAAAINQQHATITNYFSVFVAVSRKQYIFNKLFLFWNESFDANE